MKNPLKVGTYWYYKSGNISFYFVVIPRKNPLWKNRILIQYVKENEMVRHTGNIPVKSYVNSTPIKSYIFEALWLLSRCKI